MKKFLFLLGCVAPMVASASFDMLLVADGAIGKVRRYDPVNKLELGSFGPGSFASIRDIAVNQSTNECFILTQGSAGTGVLRYNYNTGEALGSVIFAGTSSYGVARKITYTGGELLVSWDRDVTRINPSTGAQVGVSLFYQDRKFFYTGGATQVGSRYILAGDSDGTFWTDDFAMSFNSGNTQVGSLSGGAQATWSYRDINSQGNVVSIAQSTNTGTSAVFNFYDASVPSLANTGTGFSLTGTGLTALGVEFGHGSTAYTLVHASAASNLVMYTNDYRLGIIQDSWALPGISSAFNNYRGSAIILAPEPGSLIGVALGAIFLLRRKRN